MSHETLELDIDRDLLNDVFDEPTMRYILLYMYLVRFNVFRNLEDENLTIAFDKISDPTFQQNLTIKYMRTLLPEEIIREMFAFNMIRNLRNYSQFEDNDDDFVVKLVDVYIGESLENVLFAEEALLAIIKPFFPIITPKQISDGLRKLRAIMCQSTNVMHPLVHKYGNDYALDNDLYDILFLLGNPYLALRLELLVVDVEEKIKDIDSKIEKYMKIFYNDALRKGFINKISKAAKWADEPGKDRRILDYIIMKSRNLPDKFEPPEMVKNMEIYQKWQNQFDEILRFKNQVNGAYDLIDNVKSYYSGPNQKMSYLTFIEEVTDNEEETSALIKKSLLEIREKLKQAYEFINDVSVKEIKLLNLDVERAVIENEEDED